MHGEYKTPGGKLVAVDFEVRDGRLSGVKVGSRAAFIHQLPRRGIFSETRRLHT